MTLQLHALTIDADEPLTLARFWAGVLQWDLGQDDGVVLLPKDDTGFRIRFVPTRKPKTVQNQIHFDLRSSSREQQLETISRATGLGAVPIDIGQEPVEEGEEHEVFADPEGNEFCVIRPGNDFLAECGFVGCLSCSGTQAVGYFWSAALGWPLVWDQDEETAIRSPHGGPIISWGGPPVAPKEGKNRWHLDLAPPVGSDQATEVDRLIALGATRVDIGQGDVSWVVLADPDGNELCILTPR